MREIKFRAKLLGTGELIYFDIFSLSTKDGILYVNAIGIDPNSIQLYTGLKDKNGVKIYEGDIVKHFDYPWLKAGGQSTVEWQNDACGFKPFIKDNERYGRPLAGEWIEVIGNIYEHPELLEVK